jgi:tetratricopeptide (TPR) repeat protein
MRYNVLQGFRLELERITGGNLMENCWTCGTEVIGHHFTCNVCEKTRTNLFESPRISKSTTMSKFIEYSITELFFGKEDTQLYIAADTGSNLENINSNLEYIASVIEWGFEELSWKMDQMTVVLQSIDRSLKTPDETKANEQSLMAEELRRRGILADSEKFFLQSLELNPLDYRTYIGLAQTYFEMNKFDDGKTLLNKSLPHAIENIKKSYAYRLLGRTLFAEGKYEQAVEALELSTKLSPDYALGHYDYAQYCALTGRKEDYMNSLEIAITKEPSLIKLAEIEPNFRDVGGVKAILKRLGIDSDIFNIVPFSVALRFAQIIKDLDAVEGVLATLAQEYRKEQSSYIKACLKECERARDEIKKVRSTWIEHKKNEARIAPKGIRVRDWRMYSRGTLAKAIQHSNKAKNMVLDLGKRLKQS